MTKFLIKRFIKNYENTKNAKVRESYGKLSGIVGIVSNSFVCILKIATGLLFNSIAILADGINNLADASSSLITLVGFRMAARPADEDHPYGHARIEYITGLVVSLLIIVLGFQLFSSSLQKAFHPDPLEFSLVAVAVLVISILVKIWQAMFNIKMGTAINSATLKATGADSRNDVIATSAVLISLLIGKATGIQLDGIMGCIVALFILYSGLCLVKETSDPLLGRAPDPELVVELQTLIESYPEVLGIHDLVFHDYGPGRVFSSVHIEVDAHEDVLKSHDMVDNVEKIIHDQFHIHMVVHMDPVDTHDPLTQKAKGELEDAIRNVPGVLSSHDLRIVPGITHHNLIFDVVVSHDCPYSDAELKNALTEEMRKFNPKYNCVIDVDRNYAGNSTNFM